VGGARAANDDRGISNFGSKPMITEYVGKGGVFVLGDEAVRLLG
jgi:hypothetical protein